MTENSNTDNKKPDSIGSRLVELVGGTVFLPFIVYGSWVIRGTDSIYGFLGWLIVVIAPIVAGMLVYDWYKFLSAKSPEGSKGF